VYVSITGSLHSFMLAYVCLDHMIAQMSLYKLVGRHINCGASLRVQAVGVIIGVEDSTA
jgi:hypothetical protein